MGLNIVGLYLEQPYLDLEELGNRLDIELKESRRSTWEDAQAESLYGNELMVLLKEGKALLYYDFDLQEECSEELEQLALESIQALSFGASETSMTFLFNWYQFRQDLGEDVYTFEGDFQAYGQNRLGLGAEDDMIFDGLFPYLTKEMELKDETICVFYRWESKDSYYTRPHAAKGIADLDQKIQQLLHSKSTHQGLYCLAYLVGLIREKRHRNSKVVGASMHLSDWSDRKLKKMIFRLASDWEQGKWQEDSFALRFQTALAWAQNDLDLEDLYARKYKGGLGLF